MDLARRAVAGLSAILGLVIVLTGWSYTLGSGEADRVEHALEIDRSLRLAGQFVRWFQDTNGRLPDKKEFNTWLSTHFANPILSPGGMWLREWPYSFDTIIEFGEPSRRDSFLIVLWRGEWEEYYASWADRTSVELDESAFYVYGSKHADGVALMLPGIVLMALGCVIHPRRGTEVRSDQPRVAGA